MDASLTKIQTYNPSRTGFAKSSLEAYPVGNGDLCANTWVDQNGSVHVLLSQSGTYSESGRLLKTGYVRLDFDAPPFSAKNLPTTTLDLETGVVRIADADAKTVITVAALTAQPLYAIRVKSHEPVCTTLHHINYRDRVFTLAPGDDSGYCFQRAPFDVQESPDIIFKTESKIGWCHLNQWSYYNYSLMNQRLSHTLKDTGDVLTGHTFGAMAFGFGTHRTLDNTLRSNGAKTDVLFYITTLCGRFEGLLAFQNALEKRVSTLEKHCTPDGFDALIEHNRAFWASCFGDYYCFAGGTQEAFTVTQGYVLQKYLSTAAGRGDYPIKFNGSLFTVHPSPFCQNINYDFRRWGEPYWIQNTRLIYWNMLYSGDFEGMKPLFDTLLGLMPISIARVRRYWDHDGMLLPETFTPFGLYADINYGHMRAADPALPPRSLYVGKHYNGQLEFSFMMLEHFRYTGDEQMLERSLAFIHQSLLFFRHHFPVKNSKLYIEGVSSLETWQDCADDTPDIAGLIAICKRLETLGGRFENNPACRLAKDLLPLVPEVPLMEKDGKTVIAPCGVFIETEAKNIENPELYTVFPYALYTLDSDEEKRRLVRDTFNARNNRFTNGWSQDIIFRAMQGDGDDAAKCIHENFTKLCDGCVFPAYFGPNFDWVPDQDHGCSTSIAFLQMALQSHGDKVHVLPAWPDDWQVAFRLPTPGGAISGRFENGRITTLHQQGKMHTLQLHKPMQ